jgi:mannose-6-phosphate isomerase-like protein (cupin superfamily)
MKLFFAATVVLIAAVLTTADAGPAGVTFIDHTKVATALAKGETMVRQPDLTVLGSHRATAGQVEVHEKETDVFYVTEGEATFVTGGSMVGGKTTEPGQLRGSSINGGEAHHLAKGDVMVIPAGIPHWFKEVPKSITYYVVKVIKQ